LLFAWRIRSLAPSSTTFDNISFSRANIIDYRQSATGFDFGVETKPELAIEVKGLRRLKGDIQFTDREWMEAKWRQANYWLVMVGNLAANPMARVIRDPHRALDITCNYQKSVTAVWRSVVSL